MCVCKICISQNKTYFPKNKKRFQENGFVVLKPLTSRLEIIAVPFETDNILWGPEYNKLQIYWLIDWLYYILYYEFKHHINILISSPYRSPEITYFSRKGIF